MNFMKVKVHDVNGNLNEIVPLHVGYLLDIKKCSRCIGVHRDEDTTYELQIEIGPLLGGTLTLLLDEIHAIIRLSNESIKLKECLVFFDMVSFCVVWHTLPRVS